MRFPTVGAVYDRPQFSGMQSYRLCAVIDRPYSGESHSIAYICNFTPGSCEPGTTAHTSQLRYDYFTENSQS